MQSASLNAPDTIRRLAERMRERGIQPELEVFDAGMAHFAQVLVLEGVLGVSGDVNILLGNIASAQATPLDVASVRAALPQGWMVSLAGIGRFQLAANILGLVCADCVRVGLEDNLWYDAGRTVMANNTALVRRILRLAEEMQRSLMPCQALRAQIGCADLRSGM
ncbi:MAG: 3-keto-5-aminohexanoate cleavage protein [Nitrosospira sp.]|nr:3-keto-5-aminohexanoate cleavage protein [Nitrosospira sp.]